MKPGQRIVVISGDTASGKSSLARALIHDLDENWHLLQADDFIGPANRERAGQGQWDPDGRIICRRMLNDAAVWWVECKKVSLVVEGFFKEAGEIDHLLAAVGVPAEDDRALILHLLVSEGEAGQRRTKEVPRFAEVHPKAITFNSDGKSLAQAVEWAWGVIRQGPMRD
jgi:hypothetical protein